MNYKNRYIHNKKQSRMANTIFKPFVGFGILAVLFSVLFVFAALTIREQGPFQIEDLDSRSLKVIARESVKADKAFADAQNEVVDATAIVTRVVQSLKKQEQEQSALMSEGTILRKKLRKAANLPNQYPSGKMTTKLNSIADNVRTLIEKARNAKNKGIVLDSELFRRIQESKRKKQRALARLHHFLNRIENLPAPEYDKLMKVIRPLNGKLRTQRDLFAEEVLKAKLLSRNAQGIDSVATDMGHLLMTTMKTETLRKRKPWLH